MFLRLRAWSALACVASTVFVVRVHAQCLDWKDGFGYSSPGVIDTPFYGYTEIDALVAWDDGTGSALYAAGRFTIAGGLPADKVAKWDGSSWSQLLPGLDYSFHPHALTVFDDETGSALYVGGENAANLVQVLRWDGSSWTSLGNTGSTGVFSLAVFDDGSGPALYAGGKGENAFNVARWNGSTWTSVGGGFDGTFDILSTLRVEALTVFDDGSGPALYAGGNFEMAGGTTVNCVAKWDGSSWSDLSGGASCCLYRSVHALEVFDDGNGPRLYAGGTFNSMAGTSAQYLASWDGTAWSEVGGGPQGIVTGLTVSDQGGLHALYAVGRFPGDVDHPGGSSLRRWDGVSWTSLGGRLRKLSYDIGDPGWPLCVTSFDDGSGPALFCGGNYSAEDRTTLLNAIGKWGGDSWTRVGMPTGAGYDDIVRDLAVLDVGGGPQVYAIGVFRDAGGSPCQGIARWTGTDWAPLGDGILGIANSAVAIGSSIYACGIFSNDFVTDGVARWDGVQWSSLPGGALYGPVDALLVHDEPGGTMLYAAGDFIQATGFWPRRVARWDGSAWHPVGDGIGGEVLALAAYDDGTGAKVIAGGAFTEAGGNPADHIAGWDGATWSPLGTGLNGDVRTLLVFDFGTGPALYAGGDFTMAGGAPANRVARWNGVNWTAIGSGFDGTVHDLAVHDDGNGPALYAGGEFTMSGSASVHGIARWNGTAWKSLGSGTDGSVRAVASLGTLWVAGEFGATAEVPASHIGAWRRCYQTVSSMCYGDGTVAPCPCGNQGISHHGCDNSQHTSGARLYSSGSPVPDTLVLNVTAEMPTALTIFLQGNALIYETAYFGDGLRCAGGQLKRLFVHSAVGGTSSAPQGADPSITLRSAALGDPIPAGGIRYYQTYYRDSNPGFCPSPPGSTFNSSNGLRVVW